MKEKVVVDTNVLIAAGFNRSSSSAQIVQGIHEGRLVMVWNELTRREAKKLLNQIPPLSWGRIEELFQQRSEFKGGTPGKFDLVTDPDDHKFVALAAAAGAILVSNDDHLLKVRRLIEDIAIMTPKEFVEHWQAISQHTA